MEPFNEENEDGFDDLVSIGSLNLIDLIPTQLVPTQIDPVILIDLGQNHPDWLMFLTTLSSKSKPLYEKIILDFVTWVSSGEVDRSLSSESLFREYFVMLHAKNSLPGAASFAPSRYRSMASIFLSFWTYTGYNLNCSRIKINFCFIGKGDLKVLAPTVWVFISGWERGYSSTHSTAFTKEQLIDFHRNAPLTPNNLFLKCYSSLMCSFAARSSELVQMDWKDITSVTEDVTGKVYFNLIYNRSKKRAGIAAKTDKVSFIRGDFEVQAIENYIACF
jgi:integrase